jgi:hypothetical protein
MRTALTQSSGGTSYREIPRGGAGRAATRIASLLSG